VFIGRLSVTFRRRLRGHGCRDACRGAGSAGQSV